MSKRKSRYPAEYRRQPIELVRSGRSIGELAEEFEPSEQTIRNWVAQDERDQGEQSSEHSATSPVSVVRCVG